MRSLIFVAMFAMLMPWAVRSSGQTRLPNGVYRPGNGVSFPRVVHDVRPNYTADAIREKIQGKVTLDVIVGVDGSVDDVTIVQSLDARWGLDEEAVKAAKQWRFEPGRKDGKPVPVLVWIQMAFTLK